MASCFAGQCEFIGAAGTLEALATLPPMALPQVAMVGRSNVGKSSLINALTQRKSLARTSKHPGQTRQINFFDISKRLILVDLPGYGFARASKRERESWEVLIGTYVQQASTLHLALVLIDVQRGLMEADLDAIEWLRALGVTPQLVLTKLDKLPNSEREQQIAQVRAQSQQLLGDMPMIVTSTKLKLGIDILQHHIEKELKIR